MPKASIVPAENFNAVLIEELCKKTFAYFKMPRRFIAVESLLRTALGKAQKHLLPKA
jgi:malonyl-CoA/methylmalonyl-CoA synthetase